MRPWVKVYTSLVSDPRFRRWHRKDGHAGTFAVWTWILLYLGAVESKDGRLEDSGGPLTVDDIADALGCPVTHVVTVTGHLCDMGAADERGGWLARDKDGCFRVVNWDKRQDSDAAKRKRKQRDTNSVTGQSRDIRCDCPVTSGVTVTTEDRGQRTESNTPLSPPKGGRPSRTRKKARPDQIDPSAPKLTTEEAAQASMRLFFEEQAAVEGVTVDEARARWEAKYPGDRPAQPLKQPAVADKPVDAAEEKIRRMLERREAKHLAEYGPATKAGAS